MINDIIPASIHFGAPIDPVAKRHLMRICCWLTDSDMILGQDYYIGPVKQRKKRIIAIIFLSISLNKCFGCSNETSHRDVLLSTHNIRFG